MALFFARNWRANLQQHCSGTEPGQINLYIYVMFLQICTSTVPALCNFMDPLIRQSKYALSLKSLKMWIFAKQFFKLGKAIEDKDEFLQKTITTTNKQKLGRSLGPIPGGGKSET